MVSWIIQYKTEKNIAWYDFGTMCKRKLLMLNCARESWCHSYMAYED